MVFRTDAADGGEEVSLPGGGVGDPRPGQNGTVQGGENADHSGDGHRIRAWPVEDLPHHFGRRAIGASHFPGRQHVKIRAIRQQIDGDHGERPTDQRQRQVSLRIPNLR